MASPWSSRRPPALALLTVSALGVTACHLVSGLDSFVLEDSGGGGAGGGMPALVGNCAIDEGEACDDCNADDGDGCSHEGEVEAGWWCPAAAEPCLALSGYRFGTGDQLLVVGGDGGGEFTDSCPKGTALVGFDTMVGLELVALRGVCAAPQVRSDGELGWTKPLSATHAHGGGPDQVAERYCPADQFVVGVTSFETSVVAGLAVHCARLQLVDDAFSYGPITILDVVGDGDAMAEPATICDAPSLIVDVNGREGSRVDRLELGCRSVVPTFCGDGVVEGQEICDDGNTLAGDACPMRCH